MTRGRPKRSDPVREAWDKAESVIAGSLGFRVTVMAGATENRAGQTVKHPDAYLIHHLNPDGKIRATSPATRALYDSFNEAIRYRVEHDAACKTIWEMYCAAMGITGEQFDGLPGTDPVAVIKEEKAKSTYPRQGLGESIILGPDTLLSKDGNVINYRGEHFVAAGSK